MPNKYNKTPRGIDSTDASTVLDANTSEIEPRTGNLELLFIDVSFSEVVRMIGEHDEAWLESKTHTAIEESLREVTGFEQYILKPGNEN